jgi:RNA-binding protein YhbY
MKKGKRIAAFSILVIISFVMFGGYIVADAVGTNDDPLISLSYLNEVVVPQITQTLETKLTKVAIDIATEAAKEEVATQVTQQSGTAFVAVQVFAGQTLAGKEGTEMILRSGRAMAVCPGAAGLVDATQGLDLAGDKEIVSNHVYIIPREDGRGIKMESDGYVMVKGGFDILQ